MLYFLYAVLYSLKSVVWKHQGNVLNGFIVLKFPSIPLGNDFDMMQHCISNDLAYLIQRTQKIKVNNS